jgi:hypothetical protein
MHCNVQLKQNRCETTSWVSGLVMWPLAAGIRVDTHTQGPQAG